jgi:protein-tyrosine-phosphatase
MAEVIARREAIERGFGDVEVESAGVSAWEGAPASDGALLVALERHLDLGGHSARQLTRELVDESDLILTMGDSHYDRAIALGGAGKTHLLTAFGYDEPAPRSISDPFGGDLEGYRETFTDLQREIRRVFDRLAATRENDRA